MECGNQASSMGRAGLVRRLDFGNHRENDDGLMCVMEAVSRIAGEPWSDHPDCVCPVIGVFVRAWNDGLPDDERSILVPLLAGLVDSRASRRVEERRALMTADWLVRTYAPAWLNLAGLRDQARTLYALPEITAMTQVPELRVMLARVCNETYAAASRVDEAGWITAADDCWASAWAAAFDTARLFANDTAWTSAAAAARAAAGIATCSARSPFKRALQASASELVWKMTRASDRTRHPG